jgi:hypothetical protein
MAVIVFNLATGASSDFSTAFVVRSFCEIGANLFMGTSRGEVHVARLNEDGSLTPFADQAVVSLSKVTIASSDFTFVADGASSKLLALDGPA